MIGENEAKRRFLDIFNFNGVISTGGNFVSLLSANRPTMFLMVSSPQQGDLWLSGPPSGQGTGGGVRTHDRRVPADLRMDSLANVPPMPLLGHWVGEGEVKLLHECPHPNYIPSKCISNVSSSLL
ncbi:hypothetical protein PoB_004911900 [Plakobranchus ocellatus]|uniref:Uncharacterized protein n=1 Tax=Plakobranchus ocellatus TaxID=259542 RepID=A0AAV4BUZ7_9GAST|nr:hypothetical protein PoB_004911900 [Plakobranchus ocellatus]